MKTQIWIEQIADKKRFLTTIELPLHSVGHIFHLNDGLNDRWFIVIESYTRVSVDPKTFFETVPSYGVLTLRPLPS